MSRLEWATREVPDDPPQTLQQLAPLGLQSPRPPSAFRPLLHPRVPTASLSSLPPRRRGRAMAKTRLSSDREGSLPLSGFQFSPGSGEQWLGCLGPKSSACARGPEPPPLCRLAAQRPLRSLRAARPRPGTILSLSGAPASRVFCNLRLRLFSRAEPQPRSSSQ